MEKLEIEIGADISKLKQNLNTARDDIKGFNERAKSDTAIELSVKVAKLKADLQAVKQLLKQDIPQSVAIDLSAKSELLKRDITQAGRELTNFLRTGQTDVSVLGNMFSNLGNGMKNVFSGNIKEAMGDFKASMGGIGSAISWAATAFVWLFAAQKIFSFFSEATSEALKFEESLVRVKTVSEWSEAEYRKLAESIKAISTETGLASTQIADSAFFIASAGVALKDIPNTLEVVSKAAVATGADASIVFNGMSSVASIYGINLKDLIQVSDVFFKANAEWKLTIQGLSDSIGTVAPIANTAGVSLKELTAGFATMVGNTGNADEVAVQLKGTIQAIAAPTKETAKAARELGIELWTQAIQQKGYIGVIKDIYDKTDGNLAKIKEIIPEVRALTAVTYLGSTGNQLYKDNLDGLNQSLGETDKAFTKYTDSEVWSIARATQTWNNWKISIGEFFVSLFAFLINSATYLNKWIQLGVAVVGELVLAFGTWFAFLGEIIGNFVWFFVINFTKMGRNLKIIAENIAFNIGEAFNNIPGLISSALSSALDKVFEFFSSAINKYNEFVTFIGQSDLKINAKISSGGITKGGSGAKFRDVTAGTESLDTYFSFKQTQFMAGAMGRGLADINWKWQDLTGSIKANAKATENNIGTSTTQVKTAQKQVTTLDWLNKKLEDLKKTLWGTEVGTKAFKDLQKEIVGTQSEIDKLNEWTAKAKKWPSAGAEAKKELDAQKKLLEDKATLDIQNVKKSTDTESKKANQIIAINNKLKSDLALLDGKYYDVEAKRAEELLKQEKVDSDKLKKIKEEAYKDLTDAEKKNVEDVQKLGNAYADLKQKLAEVGKKGAEDIKTINDEIEKLKANLLDIQGKWKQDIATRGIEAQKELLDLQKKSQTEQLTPEELQTQLDLQKEISLVSSNTTPEERAKALAESQKSKTQLLIDELALNETKAKKELADAEAKKKQTEDQMVLDQKAIKDKMDAIAIQITSETQLMIAEDVKRRKLEADYTAFFGEQIAQRKAVMDQLIESAKQAQIAIQSAGISTMSGTATASSNTTANSVVQNITNNSNVDAESFLRALNNKLPTK